MSDERTQDLLDPVAAALVVRQIEARRVSEGILANLTARQHSVLVMISEGLTNAQIAERLGTTEKTVKSHVTLVLRKLGVQRRTQAALLAVRLLAD